MILRMVIMLALTASAAACDPTPTPTPPQEPTPSYTPCAERLYPCTPTPVRAATVVLPRIEGGRGAGVRAGAAVDAYPGPTPTIREFLTVAPPGAAYP